MNKNLIITKNKRKNIYNDIPKNNKPLYEEKKFIKNIFNNKNEIILPKEYEFFKKSNYEEDNYDSFVYIEPISKDKNFLFNEFIENKYSKDKSCSNILNYDTNLLNRKNDNKAYFDKNIKNNTKLNYSFEIKHKKNILNDQDNIILNKESQENDKILKKIINIFSFLHKKRHNNIQKMAKNNDSLNTISSKIKTNLYKLPSKFSRKNKKTTIKITENINNFIHINKRNIKQVSSDKRKQLEKNKIIRIDKLNPNNVNKELINNNKIKKEKSKIYDKYIMNSDYNDNLFEQERKMILRGNHINRSMRKININLNDSSLDKNIRLNKSKIFNHSFNYFNPKRIDSEKRIKSIINDYMGKENKEKEIDAKILFKNKRKEDFGKTRIIKKRVILEEEYIVNSEGDQKLLSIRRLNNENNNEENENTSYPKYISKKKSTNNESRMNKKNILNKLNSLFFSSQYNENSRKLEYNNHTEMKSFDDDLQISYIINNKKSNTSNINIKNSKNNLTNQSYIKNNKKRKIIKKVENKIPIKTELKERLTNEQKINSETSNKEKKKLFYNRIYINKFNKKNNYIHSSKNFLNYLEKKEKSKLEISKGLYEKISLSREQPFMIYHNEVKNQNFFINDNKNSSTDVLNFVFLNDKNNINNSNQGIKPYCRIKSNNYKYCQIRPISIENNTKGINSTRNYFNRHIMSVGSCNEQIGIRNNSHYNIYSSMDNVNNKKIKNLEILAYNSSRPKMRLEDIKNKYIKRIGFNNNEYSQYYIDNI